MLPGFLQAYAFCPSCAFDCSPSGRGTVSAKAIEKLDPFKRRVNINKDLYKAWFQNTIIYFGEEVLFNKIMEKAGYQEVNYQLFTQGSAKFVIKGIAEVSLNLFLTQEFIRFLE